MITKGFINLRGLKLDPCIFFFVKGILQKANNMEIEIKDQFKKKML